VEVLVLDLVWIERQQHQVALLPIDTLAFHDRIALAVEHVDDEPALVAVPSGLGANLVCEYAPLQERHILVEARIEEEPQPSLARHEPLPLRLLDHDRPVRVALGLLAAILQGALVGIVLQRWALPLARAFELGHSFSSLCSALQRLERVADGWRRRLG